MLLMFDVLCATGSSPRAVRRDVFHDKSWCCEHLLQCVNTGNYSWYAWTVTIVARGSGEAADV